MKNKLRYIILMTALCLLAVLHNKVAVHSQEDDVVPIINKQRATISAVELKRIFTGDMTRWQNGGSVRVLLNKDGQTYEMFAKKYLGMSMNRVENLWVLKKIRDGIIPPRKVSSLVIKTMVSRSGDFIGFIKRSELDDSVKVAVE
ncbi:MAG: hypothetical protein JXA07_05590 [Spirochaetes bacterium]|nr:hypothetical protein [Spirochaetota bacterium]